MELKNKIRVVIKKPQQLAETVEIENSLESFQKVVLGNSEVVPGLLPYPYCMYCNEEGKLIELTPNFNLPHGDWVAGNVVVLSTDEAGNNVGLTEVEAHRIKVLLNMLEGLVRAQ